MQISISYGVIKLGKRNKKTKKKQQQQTISRVEYGVIQYLAQHARIYIGYQARTHGGNPELAHSAELLHIRGEVQL
jgi:hypothetical protein